MNPLALFAKLTTLQSKVYAALAALALVGLLFGLARGAWAWHGKTEYERGKAEMAALVDAAGKQVTAARDAIGAAKLEGARAALDQFTVQMHDMEKQREDIAAVAAARGRALDRLRASASVGAREVSVDPADACAAPKLRAQSCDRLLGEGQRLAIEGAGLVDALGGLVGEGQDALGSDAALILLAQRWAAAVQLGKEAP